MEVRNCKVTLFNVILSVINGVHAEIDEASVNDVAQTEGVIISQWGGRPLPTEELQEIRDKVDDILRPLGLHTRLLVMSPGDSIVLYFLCMTLSAVISLRHQWQNGQLKDIVQSLFTLLSGVSQTVRISRFMWPLSNFQLCLEFFRSTPASPRSSGKNTLHEALENRRFDEASKLIESNDEAYLMECFESIEGSYKSCLHLIAETPSTEQATTLCRKLMEKINDTTNREYLLNMTTVAEIDMGRWRVRAHMAAIHIAAYNGNAEVVIMLCREYGVDVNCSTSETIEEKPKKGITALEWASRKGHVEVVNELIENDADVNVMRPTNGVTPLYIAAQERRTAVVQMLLNKNSDVNARRTDDCTTPLFVAAYHGHTEVVKLLLDSNADVNERRRDNGATPLCMAAQNGHTQVVKLLLDKNANINACGYTGATPLHVATCNGHTEVVNLLLDNNAEVNARRTDTGSTPMHAAAYNGHTELVKLLLENNADVNACRTDDGATPLYAAAHVGHSKIVKLLIDHNADVNQYLEDGNTTPISAAVVHGHAEVVKVLLAHKANIAASTYYGEKLINVAIRNRHYHIAELLE